MRRVLASCLVFYLLVLPQFVRAQTPHGWCGYALISGLPLLEGQLTVLEAITPRKTSSINPAELFQYRFNLAHTEALIEGCFTTAPTRVLIAALLEQVIPFDAKGMESQLATIDFGKGEVTTSDVVQLYIEDTLSYTIFEGSREESAAKVRAYLSDHRQEWEPPCDDHTC